MSRYIEEKDVYKLVEPNGVARVHCSQIDDLPRADVVEVRHGEWIVHGLCNPKCSICKSYGYYKDRYCPNCGAKMDGERSENGK